MRLRACIFCAEYNFGRDFGNVRFIAFMLQVGGRGSTPSSRPTSRDLDILADAPHRLKISFRTPKRHARLRWRQGFGWPRQCGRRSAFKTTFDGLSDGDCRTNPQNRKGSIPPLLKAATGYPNPHPHLSPIFPQKAIFQTIENILIV